MSYRWLGFAGLLAAVGIAAGLYWKGGKGPVPGEEDPFPLAPVSSSPFLNTGPDARYVGSETCRSCHPREHTSFRRSGMGQSMARVTPEQEPPDASYDHAPSKRRYQVRRKDGQLWHRELLLTDGPDEVVLAEYPVQYVVGSGRHSRTYLVEIDGFLVESPVTWYAVRKAWSMSPGYDSPNQVGFERATGDGCLLCHAGQSAAVEGSLHRMQITEAALACERCHGPGSLHLERHKPGERDSARSGEADHTIVNPTRLPRELAEAVCQQCHLRSNAVIVARGRTQADFRPGLPLQDFRHDYWLDLPGSPMTVVGHVEQMHSSRCYKASDTLSCLTCHDPHHVVRPDRLDRHYNALCMKCHAPERCTIDKGRREKESPANSCIHCHMPRSPTEIPHLAFTHHRIGIHDRPAAERIEPSGRGHDPGVLRPFLDLSRLGKIDRERSLGLGHLETANREKAPPRALYYRRQALELLSEVRGAGLRDGPVDAALARLRFDMELGEVLPLVESALGLPGLDGQERCNVLFLQADELARQQRHDEAVDALHRLTRLRRHSIDWVLLAHCEQARGNHGASMKALETATRINPRLWKAHQHLAEYHRQRGDRQSSAYHQMRAVP